MEDVSCLWTKTNGSIELMHQCVTTLKSTANQLIGQVRAAVQIPHLQKQRAKTISFFVISQIHALTKVFTIYAFLTTWYRQVLGHGVSNLLGPKKQGFWSKINCIQMKLLSFLNWISILETIFCKKNFFF